MPSAPFARHDQTALTAVFAGHGMMTTVEQHEIAFTDASPATFLEAEPTSHPMAIAGFEDLNGPAKPNWHASNCCGFSRTETRTPRILQHEPIRRGHGERTLILGCLISRAGRAKCFATCAARRRTCDSPARQRRTLGPVWASPSPSPIRGRANAPGDPSTFIDGVHAG